MPQPILDGVGQLCFRLEVTAAHVQPIALPMCSARFGIAAKWDMATEALLFPERPLHVDAIT